MSWVWLMITVDIMLMNGEFAESRTALACVIITGIVIVINLIGDRIENIKFKEFSTTLAVDRSHEPERTHIGENNE
jgi:hypothetical protein